MQVLLNRQLKSVPWQLEWTPAHDIIRQTEGCEIIVIQILDQWRKYADSGDDLSHRGVKLAPTDDVSTIVDILEDLPVIALDFSDFVDGRVYSQAVLLRTGFGYHGNILGLGAELDNFAYLERCGVDAIAVTEHFEGSQAIQHFNEIETVYSFSYG